MEADVAGARLYVLKQMYRGLLKFRPDKYPRPPLLLFTDSLKLPPPPPPSPPPPRQLCRVVDQRNKGAFC